MWAKLLSFLSGMSAKMVIEKVMMFMAIKTVVVFLFIIVIPLLLNNMIYELLETIMNFSNANSAGVTTMGGPITMTGVAGYLMTVFRVPECLSILGSALQLRLVLKMIPFSPL